MKDDTISRVAAIKAADSIIERDTSGNNDVVRAMTAWKEYIKALPTVDAAPVKHGRWTIEDCHAATYWYCCSNCTAHHRARYAYCPSCGAVMDGKDGDGNV